MIAQLGLEGTENVLIGSPEKKGISGGQRKRVNLAMELLTDPAVLFLDEPTSGLSSEDALMVMKLLRKLADGGKTIIVTIHQPSLEAYRLLDNLILVSKDARSAEPGRLAYFGPAYPQAVEFFNPDGVPGLKPGQEPSPDEVLRGLAKDKTAAWVERYEASPLKRQFVDRSRGQAARRARPRRPERRTAPGLRLRPVVDARAAIAWPIKLRDTANTAILMAQAPVIALLVVLVFGKPCRQGSDAGELASRWPAPTSISVFLCLGRALVRLLQFGPRDRRRMGHLSSRADGQPEDSLPTSARSSPCSADCVSCSVPCLLGIVYSGAGLKGPWLVMFCSVVPDLAGRAGHRADDVVAGADLGGGHCPAALDPLADGHPGRCSAAGAQDERGRSSCWPR